MPASAHNLIRLLQLSGPGLPVGNFAYSQGMEFAAEEGLLPDATAATDWIRGVLHGPVTQLDLPVFARLYAAARARDAAGFRAWNEFLLAARETAELRAEEINTGRSLRELWPELGLREAGDFANETAAGEATWTGMFAYACAASEIPPAEGALGLLWSWLEARVTAAVKIVPLGGRAGQRILATLGAELPAARTRGLALADEDIGAAAPGLAHASARHETQYTRLFLS